MTERRAPTRGIRSAQSSQPGRRPPAPPRARFAWLRPVLGVVVLAFLAVAVALVSVARDLPDIGSIDLAAARSGGVVFLDSEDRVISRRGATRGATARVEDLPDYLVDAVLAVEDRRFYSHFGIDLIGTARAALANLRAGRVVQGGSTITQQLAKNLFLTPERTFIRKVQELLLAFELERRFSKNDILALYLDRVYFGAGAWGVEAASQRYFGRSAREVNLGEAALLAGLLKAPSRYSPAADLDRAGARATVVLDLMYQTGRITEAERLDAAETPVRVTRATSSPGAQYFLDWIAEFVRERIGDRSEDIIVRTTLDVTAQRAAEAALAGILADPAAARGATEGAIVALRPDGSVMAMAGGRDYARSQFNRAVLARRQPGSAFKPFVYAAAFEGGLAPWDVREDMPIQIGDWRPQNYGGEYRGPMTLRDAFSQSSNMIAVRLAEETGRGNVARLAQRLGVASQLRLDRSMALGSFEVTPLELATAYTPFANGGRRIEAFGVLSIETAAGEIVWEREALDSPLVLDARTLGYMRDLMETAVREGTGRAATTPGHTVGGKTGTTNDFRDAWFAGYADGMTVAVWAGNDDFSATENAVGGAAPARIFRAFAASAPIVAPPSTPVAVAEREMSPLEAEIIARARAEAGRESQDERAPERRDAIGDLLGRLNLGD